MKRSRLAGGIGAVGLVVGVVLLAVLPSAGAANGTFQGVVLAKSSARHALAVSSRGGLVRTVRVASTRERIGSRVNITARQLRDGTFQAIRVSTTGRADLAKISRALVIRARQSLLLVSVGGSTIAIRPAGRRVAGLGGPAIHRGEVIDATVRITSSGRLTLAAITGIHASGTSGASGASGATGASGDEGEDDDCTGASGASGATGDQGDDDQGEDECGASGASGASGDQGDDDSGDDDQGDDDSGGGGDVD